MENKVPENAPFRQLPEQSRASIEKIEGWVQSFIHALQCRDESCTLPNCKHVKKMLTHMRLCQRKAHLHGVCPICKKLISLCCFHAKSCQFNTETGVCPVPYCLQIKQKLQQKYLAAQGMDSSGLNSLSRERSDVLAQGFVAPSVMTGPQTQGAVASLPAQHHGYGLEPESSLPSVLQTVNQVEDEAAKLPEIFYLETLLNELEIQAELWYIR